MFLKIYRSLLCALLAMCLLLGVSTPVFPYSGMGDDSPVVSKASTDFLASGNQELSPTLTLPITPSPLKPNTGDAWLDEQLELIAKKHDYDLWRCFVYVSTFPYEEGPEYPTGDWENEYAKSMLVNGAGNCYCYAALFCLLARTLGYNAQVIAGHVPSFTEGDAPHGWVEIRMNGQTYLCDAGFHSGIPSLNWYWVTYANAPVKYQK